MIFNKKFFFLISFLCLSACGLRIGEPAPPTPLYKLSVNSDYCSQLNYKKEFSFYFLEESADQSGGERLSQALDCLSLGIVKITELINHEYLDRQQLINILNQDFIKTKDMEPVINRFLDEEYFDDYISIKNDIIHFLKDDRDKTLVYNSQICQRKPKDKNVLSKEDIDVAVHFLNRLSEFFLAVEFRAYEVFESFFKSRSLFLKSQLVYSNDFASQFISFLIRSFSEDFPSYSRFLKNRQLEIEREIQGYNFISDHYNAQPFKKLIRPLWDVAYLPSPSSERLTVQNVKYMMLNIYIVKTIFDLYDVNQDFLLNAGELEALSCLITPLISVVVSPELKKQWRMIQKLYEPKAITSYLINYQQIPPHEIEWYLLIDFVKFAKYRLFEDPQNLNDLSYTDVSRLISVLLLEFFRQVKLNDFLLKKS